VVYVSVEYADASQPPAVVFIAEVVVVLALILLNVKESRRVGIRGPIPVII
jgi:hypothetical protein